MFCSQCGKQIPDGSKFCPSCGHRIICEKESRIPHDQRTVNVPGRPAGMGSMSDTSTDRQRQAAPSYMVTASNKKNSNLKKWLSISFLIILAVTIAVSIPIYIKMNRKVLIKVVREGSEEVYREYEYDEKGNQVTEIQYENDYLINVNELDGKDNVLSSLRYNKYQDGKYWLVGENKYSFDYNKDPTVRTGSCSWYPYDHLENPDGSIEFYYRESSVIFEGTFEYEYDRAGNILSKKFHYNPYTEFGGSWDITEYVYDSKERLSMQLTWRSFSPENEEPRELLNGCKYYYDKTGRVIREDHLSSYSDDGTGEEWSVDYSLYYVYGNRSDAGKAGDKVKELGGKTVHEYDELF